MLDKEKLKGVSGLIKNICIKAVKSVWLWLIMLFPAALILRECVKHSRSAADFYLNNIYRYISIFWSNVSGALPFSLGELIMVLLPVVALIYIISAVVIVIKSKGKRIVKALKSIVIIAACAGSVFFLYVTNCGMNYYCTSVAELSGLDIRPRSSDELYEVCVYLAKNASKERAELKEDEKGVVSFDRSTLQARTRDAVNSLNKRYSYIPDGYSIPKSVMLSRGMSYLNITGVYFPFTFEANVNTDMPDLELPFTMCHELAHVRGIMREQEANFTAYLACIYSGDNELMYSGYVTALMYASSALYSADTVKYKRLTEYISEDIYKDMRADSEYWTQFETPVAEVASAVNDSYLKSNSQSSGIKSYGMMTDLIIAHYFDGR